MKMTIVSYGKLQAREALTTREFENITRRAMLLDNRNINWVRQVSGLMKQKRLFLAVGAGHLTGKYGVIELLREKGFTVLPLKH